MKIEMGNGEWLFSKATDETGAVGLLIRKAEKAYAVGELDHDRAGKSELKDGDIFITIPSLASALILQEQIVSACIDLQKWEQKP